MQYIVIETHPNSGGWWVGKIGTRKEIEEYVSQTDLDYVAFILELRDGGEDVTEEFLSWDWEINTYVVKK